MEAKRIEWIDLAKGMAIFLMVCGHTSIPVSLSNWIWSFHMPLFFVVSGMLFFPNRYLTFIGFVEKRSRTLLIPWLVFTLIIVGYSPTESFHLLLKFNNLYALWFLPVLFLTELIGYYIVKIRFWEGKLFVAICLATIGFALGVYCIKLPFNLDVSLYATLFYIVGYIGRDKIAKVHGKWLVIIGLLMLNILLSQVLPRTDMAENKCGWYGVNALNALIGTMAFFLLAKRLECLKDRNYVKKFFVWAGTNTIVILGLSQVINLIIKGVMENVPIPGAVNSLLRHISLWMILWGVAALINKYIPEVIGKKRIFK